VSRATEGDYLAILTGYIQVCATYKPKLGHGTKAGYELDEFRCIYGADPFYNWFGLDHPLCTRPTIPRGEWPGPVDI